MDLCPHWLLLFDLTPSDPDFAKRAPFVLDNSIHINAPPEVAFDAITLMENGRDWVEYFLWIDWLQKDVPLDRRVAVQTFYFMSMKIRNIVADRAKTWIASVDSCSVPLAKQMLEVVTFGATPDGGCDFRWQVYYEPLDITKPLNPIVEPFFNSMFKKSTESLKAFCEKRR